MTASAKILQARFRPRTREYVAQVELTYDNPLAGEEGQPPTLTSRRKLTIGGVPTDPAERNAFIVGAREEMRGLVRDMLRKLDAASGDVVDPGFEGEDITLGA